MKQDNQNVEERNNFKSCHNADSLLFKYEM